MSNPTEVKKEKVKLLPAFLAGLFVLTFCSIVGYFGFWILVFSCHINNVSTDATVLGKEVIDDPEDGPSYHVLFEYKVDNNTYTNRTSYPKLVWNDIKEGGKIRIRYFAPLPGSGAVPD